MSTPSFPQRAGRRSSLVTDDGLGAHAIVIDEATGCHLWQGDMNGPEPRAAYRGVMVNPRHLAYERAGHSIPPGHRLVPTCGHQRCIRLDHQKPQPLRRPPAPPKPRPVPMTPVRTELAGRLPAERPPHIRAQDWLALTAVVSGKKLAEVAVELGVSRQRVHQLVERARQQLAQGSDAPPARRSRAPLDAGLLTTREVATRLGVTPHRVSALARSRGVGQMRGRDRVFTEADVAAMQDRRPGRPRSRGTSGMWRRRRW